MEKKIASQTKPYVLSKFDLVIDIMRDCPRAVELLAEYGMYCVTCFAADMDTLEQGAMLHSKTQEEMDEMIHEINTELEKEWRELQDQRSKIKDQRSKFKDQK